MIHCWKGKREHIEETVPDYVMSDAWHAAWRDGEATCMLEEGHEGDHVFTPDSQITITFPQYEP